MRSYGGFQIVLLEHIEESYWLDRQMTNFKLVDKELRNDYGLIQVNSKKNTQKKQIDDKEQ